MILQSVFFKSKLIDKKGGKIDGVISLGDAKHDI